MNYSEAAYFDKHPCQHVVEYLERRRLRSIRQAALRDLERVNSRKGLIY